MLKNPTGLFKAAVSICASVILPAAGAIAAVIKGSVADTGGVVLPGATVQLIHLPDTLRKGAVMAGTGGDFLFKDVAPGKYVVVFSMSGMDDSAKDVMITDSTSSVDLGETRLSEKSVTLQEAVVTAVRAAVTARQDTLEFNADSFRTRQNASVEDLLKKLPGVEVGSDGSITSGGKTITKILVDGKEFFADDPKVASKNLPSEIIDKVQVVERKSDAARLTGIDDGDDETVINLTVKKGMNTGWFGNVAAGYATGNRYEGSFNVNYFKDGNQITLLGGGNNINEAGFSDMGRGRFRDFGGNNGINSTQQFGLNFNVGKDETFRVGGNVFYTHSDRNSRHRSQTQYLFPDSVSVQNGESHTRDRGHNIRADFRMQWNIDPQNTLEFRPRFSFNSRNSELNDTSSLRSGGPDGFLVNTDLNRRHNRGLSYEAEGNLIFNHKFASHPGRSFSIQTRYSFSDTRQKTTTWNDIEYLLRQNDSEQLFRFLDNKEWSNYLEGRLTWTEPIGDASRGHFLNFAYRASYRWNNGDRLTYDLPVEDATAGMLPDYSSAPDGAVADHDLSNRFRNQFMNQELQIGYKRTAASYNLDAGVLFAPSFSQSEDLINSLRDIPRHWVWNIAPYARFRYKFSATSSLMANYRARTSQPALSALQPVADVSDPLNIIIGNPDLRPTFTQSIGAHFNNFDQDSQRSIFAVLNASLALNSIVSRTMTDPSTGSRTTTYSNADGNWTMFAMMMMNAPIRKSHWRYNVRLGANYFNTPGYINGQFNRSGNLSLNPAAGITYSIDLAQFSINPAYSFSMATNSLPDQKNRYTHAYGFNASAQINLPFGLELSTDLDFSRSSGYSSGYNTSQWLWNAQISYSTLADRSLTFSARAYDLLGQKKNISRTVSANIIADNEYNDLTRYVMFSVSWKFNTMGKKTAVRTPDDFPGDPERPGGERPRRSAAQRMQGPPPGGPGGFGPR